MNGTNVKNLPVGEVIETKNGRYKSNPGHTVGPQYKFGAGIEPDRETVLFLFDNSVTTMYNPDKPTRWAYHNNILHRFAYEGKGSDTWHWNGSINIKRTTLAPESLTLRSRDVPRDIKEKLKLPKQGW